MISAVARPAALVATASTIAANRPRTTLDRQAHLAKAMWTPTPFRSPAIDNLSRKRAEAHCDARHVSVFAGATSGHQMSGAGQRLTPGFLRVRQKARFPA